MTGWRAHTGWIVAALCAVALMAASDPLLGNVRRDLTAKLGQLETKRGDLARSIQNLRDDAAATESLKSSISAEDADHYLLPVDRLEITSKFDALATASRLGRFSYTLSPEQIQEGTGLAQSVLSVEAEAPNDVDAVKFIRELLPLLPGRADMERLSINRIESGSAAVLAAMNVRFNVTVNWLSNESRKAGGP